MTQLLTSCGTAGQRERWADELRLPGPDQYTLAETIELRVLSALVGGPRLARAGVEMNAEGR